MWRSGGLEVWRSTQTPFDRPSPSPITHRPSLLEIVDKVLVLRDGKGTAQHAFPAGIEPGARVLAEESVYDQVVEGLAAYARGLAADATRMYTLFAAPPDRDLDWQDAGVAGVVAMRYNLFVVTAAQLVAGLYASLVRGAEQLRFRHAEVPEVGVPTLGAQQQRTAAQQLRAVAQALELLHQRGVAVPLLRDRAVQAILVTDDHSKIILMNQQAEQLFQEGGQGQRSRTQAVRANDTKFTTFISDFTLGPAMSSASRVAFLVSPHC